MSTEEPKPGSETSPAGQAGSDGKVEPASQASGTDNSPPADVDAAVAWPPPEAAPAGDAPQASAASSSANGVQGSGGEGPAGDADVMTAPTQTAQATPSPPADGDMPAATPQEEMGLSNSTLHWLEDGDQAVPSRLTEPGTMPSYDPRAPVAGRRRAVLVVGGAGLVALIITGWFYAQAQKHRAEQPPAPVAVEPARDLTAKAEAALAANRLDEALDLAHLALVADQRFADAHFIVASVQQARKQNAVARDEYRKYLELAPLGTHAQAARTALSTLPP